MPLTVGVAGLLIWLKFAFMPAVWLLLTAAFWMWPSPPNGTQDPTQPGYAGWNYAKAVKKLLVWPGAHWGVGVGEKGAERWWIAGRDTRVRVTTLWACGLAVWAAVWPTIGWVGRPGNALCTYAIVQSIMSAKRKTLLDDGTKVPPAAAGRGQAEPQGGLPGLVLAAVWLPAGAVVGYLMFKLLGWPTHSETIGDETFTWPHWTFVDRLLMSVPFVFIPGLAIWTRRYTRWQLKPFYDRRDLEAEWTKRWQDIGRVPPALSKIDELPADNPMIKVGTFAVAEGDEPMSFVKEEGSLESSLMSSMVCIYALSQKTATGAAIAGSRHQMGLRVAWADQPLGDLPHLNGELPAEVFEFAVRAALGRAFSAAKLDRAELMSVKNLHRRPDDDDRGGMPGRDRGPHQPSTPRGAPDSPGMPAVPGMPDAGRPADDRPGPPGGRRPMPGEPSEPRRPAVGPGSEGMPGTRPPAPRPPGQDRPAPERPRPAPQPAAPPRKPLKKGAGLWMATVRLHGGTTMQKLRDKTDAIRTSLGADWLQIAQTAPSRDGIADLPPDQAVIVFGVDPGQITLQNRRHDLWLESLRWSHVWTSAKVTGENGRVPQLVEVGKIESNKAIDLLTFELPPGLSYEQCRSASDKVAAVSNSVFIEFRRVKGSASRFQVLSCLFDPLPELVPYRFESPHPSWEIPDKGMTRLPIGLAPDGTTVSTFFPDTPHFGVWGGTGSGKSFGLMTFIYGALVRNWEVVICDAVKEAADFKAFRPWCEAMATTIESVSNVVETVYQEVLARKRVNSEMGAANWMELDPAVRPRPLLLVIDEAFSTVSESPVPRGAPADIVEEAKQMNAHKGLILDRMGRIAREARSAGVYMIIAAQRGDAQVLKGEFKANLLGRLGLGSMAKNERELAFKSPEEAPSLERGFRGRGIVEQEGALTTIVQTFFAKQPDYEAHLRKILGEGHNPEDVMNQLPSLSTTTRNRAEGAKNGLRPPPVPAGLLAGPGRPGAAATGGPSAAPEPEIVFDPRKKVGPAEHTVEELPAAAVRPALPAAKAPLLAPPNGAPVSMAPPVPANDLVLSLDDDAEDGDVLVFNPDDWD